MFRGAVIMCSWRSEQIFQMYGVASLEWSFKWYKCVESRDWSVTVPRSRRIHENNGPRHTQKSSAIRFLSSTSTYLWRGSVDVTTRDVKLPSGVPNEHKRSLDDQITVDRWTCYGSCSLNPARERQTISYVVTLTLDNWAKSVKKYVQR